MTSHRTTYLLVDGFGDDFSLFVSFQCISLLRGYNKGALLHAMLASDSP
jgi:hypothetical protein